MPEDDLAPLFAAPPAGPALQVTYRQGIVRSFNVVTLENTVDVGGTLCTNLPLLGVGEATLLTAGSVVGIAATRNPDSGAVTYFIMGRLVVPNTADAFNAVALLSAQTASGTVLTQEPRTSTSYGDLATAGPTVNVTVRQTGKLLITLSCWMQWLGTAATGGDMGISMDGANTLTPTSGDDSIRAWQSVTSGVHTGQWTPCAQRLYEGLNPGLTTIKAVYKSVSGGSVDFSRRVLTVQTL